MLKNSLHIILLILTLFFYVVVQADDSSIGYVNGSLIFTKDNNISLENESLIIQSSKIHINYVFYNHSNHSITKEVAFPFPAKPYDGSIPTRARPCFDNYIEKNPSKDCPFLDFTAKVNGIFVKKYKIHYTAIDKNGQDITHLLTENNIPLSSYFVTGGKDFDGTYIGNGEIDKNPKLKAKLKKLGISPDWSTQILLSWQETFPAKTKVLVEGSYTPSSDGSVGIACANDFCLRKESVKFFKKACQASKPFIIDKKTFHYASEHFISGRNTIHYILPTGANWKDGLIKHFHFEVIPTKSELVGFCYPNPMKFEAGKYIGDFTHFLPKKDISVTFIKTSKEIMLSSQRKLGPRKGSSYTQASGSQPSLG